MDKILNQTDLNIRVVYTEDDRLKAMVVRSLIYIAEQDCPYEEEFDLNDYSSTHIIGTLGKEPILTARIRYFGHFAKLERLAVRKAHRGLGYGKQLLEFMINFCVTKGYKQIYLHAQEGREAFYSQFGFQRKRKHFAFSGYRYSEMILDLDNKLSSFMIEAAPMLLNRPEGRWGSPGPLEAPPFNQPIAVSALFNAAQL